MPRTARTRIREHVVALGETATLEELRTAEVRADRWSDAHVEGECSCGKTPRNCGEAAAAQEIVETR